MRIHLPLLGVTLFVMGALLAAGIYLTDIDTDVTRFLPEKGRVFADAGHIFKHHPIQSEMIIDLGVDQSDPDRLVSCATWVTGRLKASGLFKRVGTDTMQGVVPELMAHVVDHLPYLFTSEALESQVLPKLSSEAVGQLLKQHQQHLFGMDAIGQTAWMARDPLELRHLILAKLAHLAPADNIQWHKGQLLSNDGRHLLVVAAPMSAGTDTANARHLDQLIRTLSADMGKAFGGTNPVTLTAVGAYRAALDNEQIVRRDVKLAIGLATLGIAVLLVLVFPRPLVGLFAFLPAMGGTVTAFFVMAVMYRSISIMALGFGGAIISITVDHGIAYLLFLDRSKTSYGKAAAKEVWAIGLLAVLTSVGAFSALCLTGFPMFAQLGLFSAMGIGFSFLFVHLIFPKLFPQLPPARERQMPLRKFMSGLPVATKGAALAAVGFALVMLFWAWPEFNTQLSAMNTVRQETTQAEHLVTEVWGDAIFQKSYLMSEAKSSHALQEAGDALLDLVEADVKAQQLTAAFVPAMIFPGKTRREQNRDAWRSFWRPERVAALQSDLKGAQTLGFAEDAFAPFLKTLQPGYAVVDIGIPEAFLPLMGIVSRDDGTWMQFTTLTPGPRYDGAAFHERYQSAARIFDPTQFSETMGRVLFATFAKMLIIIGASVAVLLLFFFLDWRLSLTALSPVLFALVCTLGTLKLLGQPLDIPALMLAIVVFGMGIDYALFLTRAYQRYGRWDHPDMGRIKLAVMMAAASTLIGFGVLCLAEHRLLQSAGLTSLLGIGYALLGAFILLPPLLERQLKPRAVPLDARDHWRQRVMAPYHKMETYPRLFAHFKLKYDVMFEELPRLLSDADKWHTVLDIGCGYGVPGSWILDRYPNAQLYGIDPDAERIRVAARAFGDRGHASCDLAPNIPQAPQKADAAFLLDIIHFLNDSDLALTLQRLAEAMHLDALLVIRAVIPPPDGQYSKLWRIDVLRRKLAGMPAYFRSTDEIVAMLAAAGFHSELKSLSGDNPESVWLMATLNADTPVEE